MAALAASDVTVAVTERKIIGNQRRYLGTITFGDGALTYPTGGIPLPGFAAFGMVRNLSDISINGVNGLTTDYQVRYDRVNNKLQLFEEEGTAAGGPLLECDTGEAPAARTYFCEFIGF